MHNESDFRNLLRESANGDEMKEALRWRAYAQLGAGLSLLLLVLVIAFNSDGSHVDGASLAQATAATPPSAGKMDGDRRRPAQARPEPAASGSERTAASVSVDGGAAARY